MAVFLLISTFSFFSLLILGIRVLQEPRSKPSLLFGLYALAAAFVSLLELMIRLSESLVRAQFFANAAFLWPVTPALFLHFVLVATLRRGALRTFLVSLDYTGAAVMGSLYALFVRSGNALEWRYGWELTTPFAPEWPWAISTIIVSIYVVSSLGLLLFRAIRPGGELAPREQRWILFAYTVRLGFTALIPAVAGQFDVVLPEMNSLAYAVFTVLVYVGISRAYLLSLTPQRTVGIILSTMEELLFLTTTDYTIVTANRAAGSLLGLDSRKLRGRSVSGLFGLPEGDPIPGEVDVPQGPGEGRTLQILQSEVSSPSGEPIGLLFLGRDVTEDRRREATLRRTLAEKEAVLHELHHRVHNTLQTVTSLLRLKADPDGPAEAVQTLTESAEMVQRMAEIHRWAYDARNPDRLHFDEFLKHLCNDIYQEQRSNSETKLRLKTDPVYLDVRTAIPLLLLAGELLTKAFADAQKNSAGSEVHVEVSANSGIRWELRVIHPYHPATDSDQCAARTVDIMEALAQQAGATLKTDRTASAMISTVTPFSGNLPIHL